jgi:hypothetical protein
MRTAATSAITLQKTYVEPTQRQRAICYSKLNFVLDALLDVFHWTVVRLSTRLVCHSKAVSASMEIREVLVVAPVSATRRFRPTRWHPRRAGTGRAPKAFHCWRRHSNLASACTRYFSCDEGVID